MDWKQRLADLRERGWTQLEIAKEIGASQATVSDLNNGKNTNPAYSIGTALAALHKSGRRPAKAKQAAH